MFFPSPLIWTMVLALAGVIPGCLFAMHIMHTKRANRYGKTTHHMPDGMAIIHQGIKLLLRLGVRVSILGPMMLLTVRGRKTGEPRTTAVDVYELAGRRFLIATHGEGNWVRNLRAAGQGTLGLGHRQHAFTSTELPSEEAGRTIKELLGPLLTTRGIRGMALRRHFGVAADASLQDFIRVARSHPVFEIKAA